MKALLLIVSLMMGAQAFAIGGLGKKMASAETVAKAKANPAQYRFDDGGNISFGNGYFVRRFNFKGQPNVCHAGNYIYAGVRNKCIKPVYNDDEVVGCSQYKKVELKTQMVGTAQVCTDNDDDNGPCAKFATVKFNKGPQVRVAIYKKSQMDDDNKSAGFQGYTYLTIPACGSND